MNVGIDKRKHLVVTGIATIILTTAMTRALCAEPGAAQTVGPAKEGMVVPTGQLVRPAGVTQAFSGRPVDVALSPQAKLAFFRLTTGLLIFDAEAWKPVKELPYPVKDEGSMHGLAVSKDGRRVFVTGSTNFLMEARSDDRGKWTWQPAMSLGKGNLHLTGIALSPDDSTAYVCVSILNGLVSVDLKSGTPKALAATGVCPFAVALSPDGRTAYVSNFGGRKAKSGERAEATVGTPAPVDGRSIGASGTIARIRVDGAALAAAGDLEVGLHPSDLRLSPQGARLYVANANSDSVSVVDVAAWKIRDTIDVRPNDKLPFGSIANALALTPDGRTLFVANGGNNAVAVIALADKEGANKVRGFIPAGWFPGGLATDGRRLFVANVKGEGSHSLTFTRAAWNSREFRGSVTRVDLTDDATLARYTAQVSADAHVPPAEFAGPHGKGLKRLGLTLDRLDKD